jgi:hypothetical protein
MYSLYDFWKNNQLTIVTRHGKEAVIGPPLQSMLGISYKVSTLVNTDTLGTFSGEIEREHDALTTVRNKCIAAFENEGANLCLASEGSFYPDPNIPYVTINDELLLFKDFTNDFELVVRSTTHETNFAGTVIFNQQELLEFAQRVNFPSHAIILRPDQHDFTEIYKGIQSQARLIETGEKLFNKYNQLYAETDMRAHLNPTRMKHIASLSLQLAERLTHACKECGFPGFGVTSVQKGLPCRWCGMPSNYVKSHVCTCAACNHSEIIPFPNGKTHIDPMYCNYCNP